jgi:hypothetical protein
MKTKFCLVNMQIHYKNVTYLAVVVKLMLGTSRGEVYILLSIICSIRLPVFVKHCVRPLL